MKILVRIIAQGVTLFLGIIAVLWVLCCSVLGLLWEWEHILAVFLRSSGAPAIS